MASWAQRLGGTALAALLAALGTGAMAASATDDAADDDIEVIIVTAEKREENILDVPLTLSAFNDQAIEEFGMTADEDLENLVPGLQFGYDYEGQGVSMRSIGTHSAVINQADTSVAFYVDGVYSYKHYGIAPNMFDLARIEVARGPQGTLNGRNSIAGAVSYVTQRPTDTWDVNVLAEFTDQVTQRYGLAFGGPIADNWSFRLTASYYGGDGARRTSVPAATTTSRTSGCSRPRSGSPPTAWMRTCATRTSPTKAPAARGYVCPTGPGTSPSSSSSASGRCRTRSTSTTRPSRPSPTATRAISRVPARAGPSTACARTSRTRS